MLKKLNISAPEPRHAPAETSETFDPLGGAALKNDSGPEDLGAGGTPEGFEIVSGTEHLRGADKAGGSPALVLPEGTFKLPSTSVVRARGREMIQDAGIESDSQLVDEPSAIERIRPTGSGGHGERTALLDKSRRRIVTEQG